MVRAAIICGNAWTLADDYKIAVQAYPAAMIVAVNAAGGSIRAPHLFSLHPQNFIRKRWIDRRRVLGGDFTVHANALSDVEAQKLRQAQNPDVDEWWLGVGSDGTSAWSAAKMVRAWGYELIILCGTPISAGPYQDQGPAKAFQRPQILDRYRKAIAEDVLMHQYVKSMSGWSKDFLGGIDG